MTEVLLGSIQTCERLGIARSTLTQWMEKRWIVPAQQLPGGAYLFAPAEIERARAAQARAEEATQARAKVAS